MNQTPRQLEAAERGLKRLSPQHRKLHPRAQVQALRKMAAIALGKADRCEQYAHLHSDPLHARQQAARYRAKAVECTEAMVKLNTDHDLGYRVPR